MTKPAPIPVHLISDATGSLGKTVLQAIFTQFPPGSFKLQMINFIDTEARLEQCLARLRRSRGLVIHATIYEHFKRRIEQVCRARHLPVYDLTGPTVDFLIRASGRIPQVSHRKLHELNPDYFQRIDAIEFAIMHDDGAGLKTLHQADVILTGVSRTTKTPTSMVLAVQGYRAANVPLVAGVEPPRELLKADRRRVVCLTVSPKQLAAFRAVRVAQQLGFDGGYTDEDAVRQELANAQRMSRAHRWHTLDVTGHAVEENAARVIQMVEASRKKNGAR